MKGRRKGERWSGREEGGRKEVAIDGRRRGCERERGAARAEGVWIRCVRV
jgi:hypothetical protein